MKVSEIMTKPAITVPTSASIVHAARIMEDRGCTFLPVVECGKAVGVVTGRDLATRCTAHGRLGATTPVSAIMSPSAIGINADADIEEAAILMRKRRFHRLIVTEHNGAVCGVVTLADLAGNSPDESVVRTLQRLAENSHVAVMRQESFPVPGIFFG